MIGPAMKTLAIVVLSALVLPLCQAEPRWCSVSAKDASNTGLLWGLHHNPRGRNGEGSTDAGNGIAIQIVVGVVA